MSTKQHIYKIPLYAYLHFDNTWTFSDYIEIEDIQEPKVLKRLQVCANFDENYHPVIQFLLVYDNEKVNIYEQPQYEENIADGKPHIIGFIYPVEPEGK